MAMNKMDVVLQLAPWRKRDVFSLPPKHFSDISVLKAPFHSVSIFQSYKTTSLDVQLGPLPRHFVLRAIIAVHPLIQEMSKRRHSKFDFRVVSNCIPALRLQGWECDPVNGRTHQYVPG